MDDLINIETARTRRQNKVIIKFLFCPPHVPILAAIVSKVVTQKLLLI